LVQFEIIHCWFYAAALNCIFFFSSLPPHTSYCCFVLKRPANDLLLNFSSCDFASFFFFFVFLSLLHHNANVIIINSIISFFFLSFRRLLMLPCPSKSLLLLT